MRPHPRLLLLLLLLVPAGISLAGSNLPQSSSRIPIGGRDHRTLEAIFRGLSQTPVSMDSTAEKILIRLLPRQFRQRCDAMVASWGARAKGSASLLTRPLYLKRASDKATILLLTFTCYSRAPGFGDRYYDERLALLTVRKSASSLLLIPGGTDCDTCNALSHIDFGDELAAGGDTCVSIVTAGSTDNPCCQSDSRTEDMFTRFYLLRPDQAALVLALPTSRLEKVRDAGGRDSTTAYRADLFFEKDQAGRIRAIVVSGETTFNDRTSLQSHARYEWNAKRKQFDKM